MLLHVACIKIYYILDHFESAHIRVNDYSYLRCLLESTKSLTLLGSHKQGYATAKLTNV